jgi:hypothetical protein
MSPGSALRWGYSKDITSPEGDETGSNDVIANFESHYNTALDKCFMLLEIFGVGVRNAGFQIRSLRDAYEGRTYAEFAWGPTESKKYWEVRPYCRLMSSRRDQSSCHFEAEFNAFITRYME